jgi:PKD repeat protein
MILRFHLGPPSADFYGSPTSGKRPLTVNFTEAGTGADTWLWSFGDGGISLSPTPTHTYTAAGVYTVSLRVSNAVGSDILTRTHYITVSGLSAAFSAAPTVGRSPLTVTFANQSTDYTSSLWDFGDGVTSTLNNPTHTYTAAGAYTVTLTVNGPEGSDTLGKPAVIAVVEPKVYLPLVMHNYVPKQAYFSATPTVGEAPLTVTFTNASVNYTASLWSFGDGTTSTLPNPTHVYTLPGVYTVTLTITGPGGTDTFSRANYVTVSAHLTGVRYVAPGGADGGNDCTHSGAPCATVQYAVDAATPELFDKLRGSGVGGPHIWDKYWRILGEAVTVFGRMNASIHLIVGVGETEREMVETMAKAHGMGARVHLFSFFPEEKSLMENHPQPPMGQYRRIQLARYVIEHDLAEHRAMVFDGDEQITGFGVPDDMLENIIDIGLPFMTSGCPGRTMENACNRPFANDTPAQAEMGLMRNFPFQPDEEDVRRVKAQLG